MKSMEPTLAPMYYFAADFDCDTYGAGTFNNSECQTTAGSPDTGLGNALGTPYFIIGSVLLVVAIVLAVLMIRKKRA